MSKNITIAEGTQAKNFNTVHKLRTNLIGGGTQYWVPEDEAGDYANLSEKSITSNGTYKASDDDKDGFSKVTVNVSPNLTSKSISENGRYYASADNVDGFSSVEVNVSAGNLITKEITQNGTYNASDDGAGGYSSVNVNITTAQGRDVYNGISNAPVNQRMPLRSFLDALVLKVDSAVFNTYPKDTQGELRMRIHLKLESWLKYERNTSCVLVGGGGTLGTQQYIWFWAIGVLDETAEVSITNATPYSFTITLSDGAKFTPLRDAYSFYRVDNDGRSGTSNATAYYMVVEDLANENAGSSGIQVMNINGQNTSCYVPLMTNLLGGTYI